MPKSDTADTTKGETKGKTKAKKETKKAGFTLDVQPRKGNFCRPVVKNEASRRFFIVDELLKGGPAKDAFKRAGERWSKAMGLGEAGEKRYAELIPSTPSNTEYILDKVIVPQAKKHDLNVKASLSKEGEVTIKFA